MSPEQALWALDAIFAADAYTANLKTRLQIQQAMQVLGRLVAERAAQQKGGTGEPSEEGRP